MRLTSILAALIIGGSTLAGAATTARAQSYETFYSFPGGGRGDNPLSGLTAFQGRLLGTTSAGGANTCRGGCGTVFSLGRTTGQEKVVYKFQGGAGDTFDPQDNLVAVGGVLYGTTFYGGPGNDGTVFSIDPHMHLEKIVYAFQGSSDGHDPIANLLDVGGMLYGVTFFGGSAGAGTVFSIDVATGAEKVVYAFQGTIKGSTDGKLPLGGLIQVNGLLYGTTTYGGEHGDGTAYSIDPSSGTETILHSFAKHEGGALPQGNLCRIGDKLYGIVAAYGDFNQGAVFSLSLSTGIVKVVHSFGSGNDGAAPMFGVLDVDGTLYGTTTRGGGGTSCGSAGCGTVFSLDLASKAETIVHAFQGGTDGDSPDAGLTNVGGVLYGTTNRGGTSGKGTVFTVTP